jgi:hypothetical protein
MPADMGHQLQQLLTPLGTITGHTTQHTHTEITTAQIHAAQINSCCHSWAHHSTSFGAVH